MQRPLPLSPVLLSALLVALVLSACGGGGDGDGPGFPPDGDGEDGPTATAGSSGDGGGNAGTSDEPSVTTGPGMAVAAVDGEELVYESAGSLFYTCDILADRIAINYQTGDGQDLLVQASMVSGRWTGSITFAEADGENITYSASLPRDADELGVSETAFSYEGAIQKVTDFDVQNAEELQGTIAVNCASPGGDPVAVIDGTTYTFPFSGAQSSDCEVSDTDVAVRINRLSRDDLQLAIDMRGGPDDWLGSVSISASGEDFLVTLSGEAEGFDIDGGTVTYAGPIENGAGDEVEAAVSVTCP